jgi:purine-binding chemotaxis protein CheW
MPAELTQNAADIMIGCFDVGGRRYGIDVSQIREVFRWEPATPLPQAPSLIEGVIDLRGSMIPVVDLGRILEVGSLAESDQARIVLTEVDGMIVGFSVDAAIEVLSVQAAQLLDPPSLATHSGYETTRAVVRREGEVPILVVSLEHLIENVFRSALQPVGAVS